MPLFIRTIPPLFITVWYIVTRDPYPRCAIVLHRAQSIISASALSSRAIANNIGERYSLESASLFSQRAINFFILPPLFCFLPRSARRQRGKLRLSWTSPLYRRKGKSTVAHLNLSHDNNRDYGNCENRVERVYSTVHKVPALIVTFNYSIARIKLQECATGNCKDRETFRKIDPPARYGRFEKIILD